MPSAYACRGCKSIHELGEKHMGEFNGVVMTSYHVGGQYGGRSPEFVLPPAPRLLWLCWSSTGTCTPRTTSPPRHTHRRMRSRSPCLCTQWATRVVATNSRSDHPLRNIRSETRRTNNVIIIRLLYALYVGKIF